MSLINRPSVPWRTSFFPEMTVPAHESSQSKQRWSLVVGGLLLTLLLAAVFTFGSLDVPFEPKSWRALMPLFAVNSFITAALLVFWPDSGPHACCACG